MAGLNGVGIVNGITWRWMTGTDDLVDMKSTELQFRRVDDNGSPVGDWIDLSVVTYPTGTFTQNGLGFAERVQVRARFVSSYSDAGPWNTPVMAMTSDNMDDYYQNIDDAIKGSDTYGELTDGIKEVSDSAQAAKDAAQAAQVTADGAVATNQQQQQQINNQAAEIAQNAKDITAAANAGSITRRLSLRRSSTDRPEIWRPQIKRRATWLTLSLRLKPTTQKWRPRLRLTCWRQKRSRSADQHD